MMNMRREDWRLLQKTLLKLGSLVLVMFVFLIFAYQYVRNQAIALEQMKSNYNLEQTQRQLAQQEQANYLRYLPQYQHWITAGLIGEERRQQWLVQLRKVREQHHLFEINYDIGQQHLDQSHLIASNGLHRLYRSVMTLKLGLLHAGDLLNLLTGLASNTSPMIVRDCEILRLNEKEPRMKMLQPNLSATCELDWLTVKAAS